MAESKKELKSLLIRMKEESERASLKLNIKETNMMASGPIVSWQIERENVEIVTDFLFLGFEITMDSDCSHEIKIARGNIHNLRYADDITLMAESKKELKSLLIK